MFECRKFLLSLSAALSIACVTAIFFGTGVETLVPPPEISAPASASAGIAASPNNVTRAASAARERLFDISGSSVGGCCL
jgi:hypothetical protein